MMQKRNGSQRTSNGTLRMKTQPTAVLGRRSQYLTANGTRNRVDSNDSGHGHSPKDSNFSNHTAYVSNLMK